MNSCLYEGYYTAVSAESAPFSLSHLHGGSIWMELDLLSEVGIRRNSFAAASFNDADCPLGTPLKAQVPESAGKPDRRASGWPRYAADPAALSGLHFNGQHFYFCYDGASSIYA